MPNGAGGYLITVVSIFLFIAIAVAIASAMGKAPLWVAVIALCVVEAVQVLPLK
jgi:hypothetical protein